MDALKQTSLIKLFTTLKNFITIKFSKLAEFLRAERSLNFASPGFCAISISSENIAVAFALKLSENLPWSVDHGQLLSLTDVSNAVINIESQLAKWVATNSLQNIKTTLILAHEDYRLLPLELPTTVPSNELVLASEWLIKDLIDWPLEEVAVSTFQVPTPKNAQNQKLYAIVVLKNRLKAYQELMKNVGLNLVCIDILELVLRELINHFSAEEKTVGILLVTELSHGYQVTIQQEDTLYLTRFIQIINGPEAEMTLQWQQVALETQRSLEYYESQFNPEKPPYCYLISQQAEGEQHSLKQVLEEIIKLPFLYRSLSDLFTFKNPQQDNYFLLPTLSGLLRMREF